MKEISKILYKKYALCKLGYDFMGYLFENPKELSFHHLLISRQDCKNLSLGTGRWEYNGALLVQRNSHEYLHKIQLFDEDRFYAITSEIFDEIIKGHLDIENLKAIDDILNSFEKEYIDRINAKGQPIIKPKYIEQRLLKK